VCKPEEVKQGMRVFITGATGFLGGALARALAQPGIELHALARPAADRQALDGVPITWHEGDVTAPETLDGVLVGADWVIHAAGRLGQAGVPEEEYHSLHVAGTRHVMAAALAAGSQPRVLHVSSGGVLGRKSTGPAEEDAPYGPSNAYQRSKAAGERVALEFAARGLPVVICRPEFVYGPGDRHVLGLFQAIRRGRFFYIDGGRHFCHPTFIADAVAGMLLALRLGRAGAIYHITGPRAVTFREFGETIAAALGVRPPWLSLPRWLVRLGVMGGEAFGRASGRQPPLSRTGLAFFSQDRRLSWRAAHAELGYTPAYELDAGVACSVAWYRQKGWL
jgi:nucleoside-diphosphate-sugar epimerase